MQEGIQKAKLQLPDDVYKMLERAPRVVVAESVDDLVAHTFSDREEMTHEVRFSVPGTGEVTEAIVYRARNGIAVNYTEPYMRRRDPECMLIGDNQPTDKTRFEDCCGESFDSLRTETMEWLAQQELLVFTFIAGQIPQGVPSMAIVPLTAGFFSLALGMLQGVLDLSAMEKPLVPRCFAYVAPPFRHTHFNGKQRVIHNRCADRYEIFSYNLYPGPSAKKGVYGALIHAGEQEGWITAHAAVVQVVTPYENRLTIMHEGASGGGKSEMNEHMHREHDGTLLFGRNLVSGEKHYLSIPKGCLLRPVTDDMALCHSSLQKGNGKLTIVDAEDSWFIRVDHIKNYGTDPDIESRSIHPQAPLLFLNIDAQPDSTALLWEHIEDEPGKPCPNPRFILPRKIVPDIISRPLNVDVRSFGVRTPPCTKNQPSYGIIGLFHVLPPALAWIWRLVSPRGFANPSITQSEGLASEGVGSYWPFATGRRVPQANLLLRQIVDTPLVHYLLVPNQHIGAWKVSFMPQWIMREYLARRGGVRFNKDSLRPARCSLLGYALNRLVVEGQEFETGLLQVELQRDVGEAAYDEGAKQLQGFFYQELGQYLEDDLDPLGRRIIECCMANGSLGDYLTLIPSDIVFHDE